MSDRGPYIIHSIIILCKNSDNSVQLADPYIIQLIIILCIDFFNFVDLEKATRIQSSCFYLNVLFTIFEIAFFKIIIRFFLIIIITYI